MRGKVGTSVSFSASRGDSVIGLTELAQKMEEVKNKLAALYGNTASALAATRDSFNETDNSVANYFNTFWERTDEK